MPLYHKEYIENIKSDLFTGKVFGEPVTLQVTNHLELPGKIS
jgi:hypothetical protein